MEQCTPYVLCTINAVILLNLLERSVRRVKFNVDALRDISSSAVGAQSCIRFETLAQGSSFFYLYKSMITCLTGAYNKLYLLEFDNGVEAVARLPCSLVGNVHMSTASEVATMEYVQEIVGKPTPRVLAWSDTLESRAAVGSDFILMERINGISLEDRWLNTFDAEIGTVLKELVFLDARLHQRTFLQIGSLFFKEDVSPELQNRLLYMKKEHNTEPAAEKYRIGPVVDKQYWFNEPIEGDRGPCESLCCIELNS